MASPMPPTSECWLAMFRMSGSINFRSIRERERLIQLIASELNSFDKVRMRIYTRWECFSGEVLKFGSLSGDFLRHCRALTRSGWTRSTSHLVSISWVGERGRFHGLGLGMGYMSLHGFKWFCTSGGVRQPAVSQPATAARQAQPTNREELMASHSAPQTAKPIAN